MASLNELLGKLHDEPLPTAGEELDDLPDFSWAPPPPAGQYRFRLPSDMSGLWDVFDARDKSPAQRVRVQFDREHPLTIIQSKEGKLNGEPYETRLSNNERNRGKNGTKASDLDYLLKACGEKAKPTSNRGYIQAVSRQGGKEFAGEITYSWTCSTERDIRAKDDQGVVRTIEGKKGCGERYYQKDAVSKNADGSPTLEQTCPCGNVMRAFTNLEGIRA